LISEIVQILVGKSELAVESSNLSWVCVDVSCQSCDFITESLDFSFNADFFLSKRISFGFESCDSVGNIIEISSAFLFSGL